MPKYKVGDVISKGRKTTRFIITRDWVPWSNERKLTLKTRKSGVRAPGFFTRKELAILGYRIVRSAKMAKGSR